VKRFFPRELQLRKFSNELQAQAGKAGLAQAFEARDQKKRSSCDPSDAYMDVFVIILRCRATLFLATWTVLGGRAEISEGNRANGNYS
jgi:hypothetical protein